MWLKSWDIECLTAVWYVRIQRHDCVDFFHERVHRSYFEACCFSEPPVGNGSKMHHPASIKSMKSVPRSHLNWTPSYVMPSAIVPSHTDKQTSNRLSLTSSPSPSATFDDHQGHGYRKGNPQQAPQQRAASGLLDRRAFQHALLQPRHWTAVWEVMVQNASTF